MPSDSQLLRASSCGVGARLLCARLTAATRACVAPSSGDLRPGAARFPVHQCAHRGRLADWSKAKVGASPASQLPTAGRRVSLHGRCHAATGTDRTAAVDAVWGGVRVEPGRDHDHERGGPDLGGCPAPSGASPAATTRAAPRARASHRRSRCRRISHARPGRDPHRPTRSGGEHGRADRRIDSRKVAASRSSSKARATATHPAPAVLGSRSPAAGARALVARCSSATGAPASSTRSHEAH